MADSPSPGHLSAHATRWLTRSARHSAPWPSRNHLIFSYWSGKSKIRQRYSVRIASRLFHHDIISLDLVTRYVFYLARNSGRQSDSGERCRSTREGRRRSFRLPAVIVGLFHQGESVICVSSADHYKFKAEKENKIANNRMLSRRWCFFFSNFIRDDEQDKSHAS